MNVELYERIWMWAAVGLLVVFLGTIVLTAASDAVHPPSHMETVDPAGLANDAEFGKPAVTMRPDGTVVVSVIAQMFSFAPDPIEVPANRPVTFRITSADVMHGFEIANSIQRISNDVLQVEEGSLYPALQRMLVKGWVTAKWGATIENRRARYYQLTAAGRKQLAVEMSQFDRVIGAITRVIEAV